MGTVPDVVKRLVDRFDQDRKVFLSSHYKEERLSKAEAPHEQESLQRQVAAVDKQTDALEHMMYGLTEKDIQIVKGGTE